MSDKVKKIIQKVANEVIDSAIAESRRKEKNKRLPEEMRNGYGEFADGLSNMKEGLNGRNDRESYEEWDDDTDEYEDYCEAENSEVTIGNKRDNNCNIIVLGKEGDGKTTLAAAITKVLYERLGIGEPISYVDIDKVSTTLNHGMTKSKAFIQYEYEDRHYTYVDCPRNEDYIRNRTSCIDAAILVVSTPDGVEEQVREQLLLYGQSEIGVQQIIGFINKCDLNDDEELLELIDIEMRQILDEYGFSGDDVPIIQGSALKAIENTKGKWGERILELIDTVDSYILEPVRKVDTSFLMSVEDCIFNNRGTLVTGWIERGVLRISENVEIIDSQFSCRTCVVTGIETFSGFLNEAYAGQYIKVLLRGIQKGEVKPGDCICTPNCVRSYTKFAAVVYYCGEWEGGGSEAICNNSRFQFYFRTDNVTGTIVFQENMERCMPSDNAEIIVSLDCPAVVQQGLRFAIHKDGHTAGIGVVRKIIK